MRKVGLLFGSFNPIHNGHIAIAEKCLADGLVDTVTFVVAYQNPFKDDYSVDFWERSNMVQLAIEYDENFTVSHVEKLLNDLGKSTKTYDVINHLEKRKSVEYYIICGDDMYNQISQWYKGDEILKKYKFIVFARDSKNIQNKDNIVKYISLDGFENISSSKIRKMIENNENVYNLVPHSVYYLIKMKNFYKNID